MKTFDLKETKAGKPICTRNGAPARLIADNIKSNYPLAIAVLYTNEDKSTIERVYTYRKDGKFINKATLHKLDLFMAPVKKSGYINLITAPNGDIIIPAQKPKSSKDAAADEISWSSDVYHDTIKIEWEE